MPWWDYWKLSDLLLNVSKSDSVTNLFPSPLLWTNISLTDCDVPSIYTYPAQQAERILSNLTAPNLEHVFFEFSFSLLGLSHRKEKVTGADWRKVDQILGSGKFDLLRRVQITLEELNYPSDLEITQSHRNLIGNFPLIMSRQTVKVEIQFHGRTLFY
jgi:hypothetical protein